MSWFLRSSGTQFLEGGANHFKDLRYVYPIQLRRNRRISG